MSWDDAQREARRWIDGLNIPSKSLQGKSINLSMEAAELKFEPKFRTMVIRAARRLLKSRGIDSYIPEPKPPTS